MGPSPSRSLFGLELLTSALLYLGFSPQYYIRGVEAGVSDLPTPIMEPAGWFERPTFLAGTAAGGMLWWTRRADGDVAGN